MKAFVTGGTGFIGSHVVGALRDQGWQVTCLVRNTAKTRSVFGTNPPDVIQGDLNDATALRRGVEGSDVTFHVAGLTAARGLEQFLAVNAHATRRVAQAVGAAGRMVYVSSLAAAGPSQPDRPLVESDPPRPVTPYGESKLAGEAAVRESGAAWTILRPPAVYGPRDVELLRVFKLARTGVVPVFGDGSQLLSAIYVEDLARAIVEAAIPGAIGRTYFAAAPGFITSRELVGSIYHAVRGVAGASNAVAAAPWIIPIPPAVAQPILWLTGSVARLTGQATVLSMDKANEFFAEAWTCSAAAFERDTGWRASHDLPSGLARTVDWYRAHGWL